MLAKFVAVFNVVAGGASIAGLYLTFHSGYKNYGMLAIFGLTAAMSAYVLFVPDTRVEQNVRSKIERYLAPDGSGELVFQRGEIELDTSTLKQIEFNLPFVAPPEIELIFRSGSENVGPNVVTKATANAAAFSPRIVTYSSDRAVFTWLAKGTPLKRLGH